MINPTYKDSPIVVDITLYKNNYIDSLLLSHIKKYAFIIGTSSNRFSVDIKDFKTILENYFKNEVELFNNIGNNINQKESNSIYFLNNLFNEFSNLKMVNVNVSESLNYSRTISYENSDILVFDYVIKQSIIDYPKYLHHSDLKILNKMLNSVNIIPEGLMSDDPYYIVMSKDYIKRITDFETTYKESLTLIQNRILKTTYKLIDPKIEADNGFLILKTDF